MTDRREFENPKITNPALSARQLQKILNIQRQVLEQAVIAKDHDGLLNELCLLAESYTPNSVASIMLYDEQREQLFVEHGPSLSPEAVDAFNGLRSGDGSCGNAVYHSEAMYVCNTFEDPRWSRIVDVARCFGICSCFSFPIFDKNQEAIGSFAISSFEHRTPEGFHRALLETCTSIAGVLLQRREDVKLQRKIFEEQVKREKLESLAVLAGGVAHDFNNLLAATMANVDFVAQQTTEAYAKESLELALDAMETAGELTRQLQTYSSGGGLETKPTDLRKIIEESSEFVLHGSPVRLRRTGLGADEFPILNLDSVQIGQLIQNLVINARQAMPEGGTIEIHCSTVQMVGRANLRDGKYLLILVSDEGPGIPQGTQGRIFDPYFTTRAEGTGLGLFLCYSIAENHGGTIELEESDENGSRFAIYLPIDAADSVETDEIENAFSAARGGSVLVMDDEEMMRRTLERVLPPMGFSVTAVSDGEEALTHTKEMLASGDQLDLAILDLTIPGGMGGIETRKELAKLSPQTKVILTTGYSTGKTIESFRECGFDGVIAKPFRMDGLIRVITETFNSQLDMKSSAG